MYNSKHCDTGDIAGTQRSMVTRGTCYERPLDGDARTVATYMVTKGTCHERPLDGDARTVTTGMVTKGTCHERPLDDDAFLLLPRRASVPGTPYKAV